MKLKTEQIIINTKKQEEMIDITDDICSIVKKTGFKNGFCKIFVKHTTAGITINENADVDVKRDLIQLLKKAFPKGRFYHSEGNSDAHLKSSLIGCQIDVPIQNNELLLGTWQGIYFWEFDGPRTRYIIIQLYGLDSESDTEIL
ncbi:MAG: secondary thiamine-phosphate synthase enzyme YjbQ [Promethearchaeota archaeon]